MRSIIQHCGGGFEGKSFVPKVRQQSETYIGIRQLCSFEYSTHADWRLRVSEFNQKQAKAMSFVTRNRAVQNVLTSVFEITDLLVSDVLKKRRFVEQRQNERRIVDRDSTNE